MMVSTDELKRVLDNFEVYRYGFARWRDAVTDKPRESGEYYVVIHWIADGVFRTGNHIAAYDAELEKWGDIEDCEVITHWLDGVPPIPEVVVR